MAESDAYEIKDSPVHGKGLYALKHFAPGALIGVYEGRLVLEESPDGYVLWMEDGEGRWFGILGDGPMKFINHSDSPNAILGSNSPFIYCARPIHPGDEIFISYGDEWESLDDEEDDKVVPEPTDGPLAMKKTG